MYNGNKYTADVFPFIHIPLKNNREKKHFAEIAENLQGSACFADFSKTKQRKIIAICQIT